MASGETLRTSLMNSFHQFFFQKNLTEILIIIIEKSKINGMSSKTDKANKRNRLFECQFRWSG